MRKVLVCLVSLSLLGASGCSTMEKGMRIDKTKTQGIVKNQTTKDQIVSMFGSPQSSDPDTAGNEKMFYTYKKEAKRLPAAIWIPFVQFFFLYSWVTEEAQNLTVIVRDGKVTNYSYAETPPTKRKAGLLDFALAPR